MIKLALLNMYADDENFGHQGIIDVLNKYSEVHPTNYRVLSSGEIPDLSYDIYLCTGGPLDLGHKYSWIPAFKNLIQTIEDHNTQSRNKKYVCFIAESYQLISILKGWSILSKSRLSHFGLDTIDMLPAALEIPEYKKIGKRQFIADFRSHTLLDTENRPPDESILARKNKKDNTEAMIASWAENFIGYRFHPEVGPESLRRFMTKDEITSKILNHHTKSEYKKMLDWLEDSDKIRKSHGVLLPMWLNSCIQKINLHKKLQSILGTNS